MGIELNFADRDWERVERDWTAWWEGELDRPMVMVEGGDQFGLYATEFPPETPVDAILDEYQARLETMRFYGDAWPKWWPNFGPGIAAGFLGATVHAVPGTVWFEPPEGPAPGPGIRDLHLEYDAGNFWWRRVQEITRRAVERWDDRVSVGITDLGGNLDILASFRTTEQLLFDVIDAPEEVERLAAEVTCHWLRYYGELYEIIEEGGRGTTPWAAIWSPGRCYMMQSDFAYMISPGMFERFVMPDLAACCDALDHGFYHLDGKGQIPHLDLLLSLERLRGIQWVPGDGQPPPDGWPDLLRRIRDGGKRCQVYVTAEGARAIVRELGGRGFALHVSDRMGPEEADDFLRALAKEG